MHLLPFAASQSVQIDANRLPLVYTVYLGKATICTKNRLPLVFSWLR